jgi:hypothetical protein
LPRHHPVPMQAYLDRVRPPDRITSFEAAREVYVAYGTLLCEAGVYSMAALAASLAKALPARSAPIPSAPGSTLAIFDSPGASGLQTLRASMASAPMLDISPQKAARPRDFLERLFSFYACLARSALRDSQAVSVTAANERSLGCAPFLAAAKFQCERRVTVVQHGNPSCDYLPTMADAYLCRSDRWFNHLRRAQLVASVDRIADFPPLTLLRFDPTARKVVLVLHNIGYLEPEVDYARLTQRIAALCSDAGCALSVLPHPANPQDFGLPVLDRAVVNPARLVIGYRSTVSDQLGDDMPRVSLLSDWPQFFLEQPAPGRLDAFVARIEEALA